jgi:hypothetical protein
MSINAGQALTGGFSSCLDGMPERHNMDYEVIGNAVKAQSEDT